ncbi:MAG: Gfo/Idh/MocA family protein [Planctomycetota bacterium]
MIPRGQFILSGVAAALAFSGRARAAKTTGKVRVAVIGHTGRGGFGHGLDTMWLGIPEAELVGVADADPAGRRAAVAKLRLKQGHADYRLMLAETKPDIVAIGPRHVDQHRDMTLAAVAHGAKGIYLEKPFCRTPAEADEMVRACEARKVRIAVAHRNRWHPVLPTMRKLIREGAIGRVVEIRGRGKEDHRGGPLDLWVLGSHVLNLAVSFTGPARSCMATILLNGRPVTREDIVEGAEGVGPLAGDELHARYETESGIPVFFDSVKDAGLAASGFGLQIHGTKGIFDLRADVEPLAHKFSGSAYPLAKEEMKWTPISSAGIGIPEPIPNLGRRLSSHFIPGVDLIDAIRDGRDPICSAREGAATIEMIMAAFESHRRGARVTLPLTNRGNPLGSL